MRGTGSINKPRSGSYAYSISDLAYGWLASDPVAVTAGTSYAFHAWLRGEMSTESAGAVVLWVKFKDGSGSIIGQDDGESIQPDQLTTSWAEYSGTVTAPAGAVSAELRLFSHRNDGWVGFDDITLTQLTPTVHYRLGGREAACRDPDGIQYMFSDHLGSATVTYRPSDGDTSR
jgi:hypothetical protein